MSEPVVTIKVNYHFYLHHTPTKTLIEKLTWTQMNSLCRTFRTTDWMDWQIWVAEIDTWFHLKDLIQEILNRSDGLFRKPPLPEKTPEGKTIEHQLIDAPVDLRQAPRYNIELPVMVDVTGSLINTFTADISITGMQLANTIPLRKEINHCYIYYRDGSDLVEFKAKPFYEVSDSLAFKRLELLSCNRVELWKKVIDEVAKKQA